MTATNPKETFAIFYRIATVLFTWVLSASAANATEVGMIELVCERGKLVNREHNVVFVSDTIFRLTVAEDGSKVDTNYAVAHDHQEVDIHSIVGEDTISVVFEFDGRHHSLMINRHTGTLYADEANLKGLFHGEGRCVVPNRKF